MCCGTDMRVRRLRNDAVFSGRPNVLKAACTPDNPPSRIMAIWLTVF